MREIILDFPKQFLKGISAAGSFHIPEKYERIIACGMGGSQMPAEIISMLRNDVIIHWDYNLPANTSSGDLVICTSWSGNTEETISSYQTALQIGLKPIVITMGGLLAQKAKENNTPFIILPHDSTPPRIATGYMVGAWLKILGMEKELDFQLDASTLESTGRELAEKIGSHVPVFITSYSMRRLAGFWKTFMNENAKTLALALWFPSSAHNDLAGFAGKNRDLFVPIIFRDSKESEAHRRNLDAVLAIFNNIEYTYNIVELSSSKATSNKFLEKVFKNYILGLWTSFYLAQKLGVDPVDTSFIEEFKALKSKISN